MDKDDLRAELEMSDVVTFELEDGSSYDAGVASYWVGGSDHGFMTDLLGNVEYSGLGSLVDAIFSYLNEIGSEIVSIH